MDSVPGGGPPLHPAELMRRSYFFRLHILLYTIAIPALFYHHISTLCNSNSLLSTFITLTLIISDLFLAFQWSTAASLRLIRVRRKESPENLHYYIKREDYPSVDIFICTADPYKEPQVEVVNTALSVMAYDYSPEKLLVYVSDDGGSDLTLFAFFEAAKFAAHWLPFCDKYGVVNRNPKVFFSSDYTPSDEIDNLKLMYGNMKGRIEGVVEKGRVEDEYITNDKERQAFNKWKPNFTRQNHPSIIEIRVSGVMTNAPLILNLDCDNYSNDPQTLERMLCYYYDPKVRAEIAFIQFPQQFIGLNKNDTYAGEIKSLFQIYPHGYDGLKRMFFYGSNGFFSRRAFFGPPSKPLPTPEMPQLDPFHIVDKSIQSKEVIELATRACGCHFEKDTDWGTKSFSSKRTKGFRYGSVVEDVLTGYRMHCEGWRAIFCDPERPAFLAGATTSLLETLTQQKRWAVGQLEIAFSKYSPLTFGLSHGLGCYGYTQLCFWSIWAVPITFYSVVPQLALLNDHSIFPKVKSPWFSLYVFLFFSAYAVDAVDFILQNGTIQRWWNDQRMWNIKGLSVFPFAIYEFILKSFGMPTPGFTLTSKAVEEEISKRYQKGLFEFGVASPMFVPLVVAASVNLLSFSWSVFRVLMGNSSIEELGIQRFLSAFAVVNSWPIYEAMVLRSDDGKIPAKVTVLGISLTWIICVVSFFVFK